MSCQRISDDDSMKCLNAFITEVLILYGMLEGIKKKADKPTLQAKLLDKAVDAFSRFFDKHTDQSHLSFLTKDIILQEKITNLHRGFQTDEEKEPDSDVNGNSLLLSAMTVPCKKRTNEYKKLKEIIILLIEKCPKMILLKNNNEDFKGITPLHVAVLKNYKAIFKLMSGKLKELKQTTVCIAKGRVFHKTPLMAGTLLGVATLMCEKKMFCDVLRTFDSELCKVSHKGDNIVHSLIKYAHVQQDKKTKDDALKMLNYIIGCEFPEGENDEDRRDNVNRLLMMKNRERLTPLQVAAKREQFEFFKSIMQHQVYHPVQTDQGAYEDEYDITEIETLPPLNDEHATDDEHIKEDDHESVLEYIVHHQTDNAFHFADFLPVRGAVKEKWRYYRWFFWGWLTFHLIFMILLSVTALYRSKLSESAPEHDEVKFEYLVRKNIPLTFVSAIGLFLSILHIILEITRWRCINRFKFKTSPNWLKRVKRHFSTPYSNYLFRVYFLLFSGLLMVDFVVAMIQRSLSDYNNICLIFAVIIGWYLFMFFIQGFKSLSFFTVLIQRVILDLLKFAFVMCFFLVGFSVAMFMIMQGADTEDDDFNHFGKTMVKMLTIMVGIGEIGILFKARQPILAIVVFVLFVIFTTILLLNALIALMSNSCTDLMSSRSGMIASKYHCRLQRLSLILYIESYLPRRLCKEVGFVRNKYRDEERKSVQRRFWSRRSVQGCIDDESENSVNALTWDIIKAKRRSKKEKTTKPKTTQTFMQPSKINVDIVDTERQTCTICLTDEAVVSQSQQTLHITDVEV